MNSLKKFHYLFCIRRKRSKPNIVLLIAMLILAFGLSFPVFPDNSISDTYIKVEIKGVLRHFIPAGDESTGTEIDAAGTTWELNFREDKSRHPGLRDLNGKMVVVIGRYSMRHGLEVKWRHIVTVGNLVLAPSKK
jgi:hypothetical protein